MTVTYIGAGTFVNFSILQSDPGSTVSSTGTLCFDTLVNDGIVNVEAGNALVVNRLASRTSPPGLIEVQAGGYAAVGVFDSNTLEFVSAAGTIEITGTVALPPAGATVAQCAAGAVLNIYHPENQTPFGEVCTSGNAYDDTADLQIVHYGSGKTPLGNYMVPGGSMAAGWCMFSNDFTHLLCMQPDGNVVVYSRVGGSWHYTWYSGTSNHSGHAVVLAMYSTGMKLLVDGVATSQIGAAVTGAAKVMMQNDGDLVVLDSSGAVLWHSNTAGT